MQDELARRAAGGLGHCRTASRGRTTMSLAIRLPRHNATLNTSLKRGLAVPCDGSCRSASVGRVRLPAFGQFARCRSSRSSVDGCPRAAIPTTSGGRSSMSCASLVASFAAGVAQWSVGGRHDGCSQGKCANALRRSRGRQTGRGSCRSIRAQRCAKLDRERITAIFTPVCLSPPAIALRPRVAARSSQCAILCASVPGRRSRSCRQWRRRRGSGGTPPGDAQSFAHQS